MTELQKNEVNPFVRESRYPHEFKVYITGWSLLLVASHLNIISVWWFFLWAVFPIIPSEVKKIYKYGIWNYLEALHFKKPSLKDSGTVIMGLLAIFSVLLVIGYIVVTYYSTIGGGVDDIKQGGHLLSNAMMTWWIYIIAVIGMYTIVGPIEELLFRHQLQNFIKKKKGLKTSIVYTNLVFAIAHLPLLVITGDILMMVYPIVGIFFIGVIFSTQYEYTENLLVPSFTHSTYNSIILTILLFSSGF